MPRKKKKKETYLNSAGRERLHDALLTGEIPLESEDMSAMEAYLLHANEFDQFDGTNKFPARLARARTTHKKLSKKSKEEMSALEHDRQLHPIATHNYRGEPTWEGSEAQRLLKQDLEDGTYDQMSGPTELYNSRPEYYDDYDLKTIRKHVHQEKHLIKLINWKKSKSKINK